jgi:NDP-sugar pyrophosphorylase family protein
MNLMMLTAGLGTRMRPLSEEIPKPAIPLLNIPLFRYALTPLEKLGLHTVVFNTHHLAKTMQKVIEREPICSEKVIISSEESLILGSAGGIKAAEDHLKGQGAFWVANGDEVFLPESPSAYAQMQAQHEREWPLATLLCTPHPEAGKSLSAVWVNSVGRVYGFGRKRPTGMNDMELQPLHYTGYQILSDAIFSMIPKDIASHIFIDVLTADVLKESVVKVFEMKGTWFETGNYQDFLLTTKQLLKLYSCPAILPPLLQELLADQHPVVRDHALVFCGKDSLVQAEIDEKTMVLCGDHCLIAKTAQLRGFVVVGDNVEIKEGTCLENVVIMPGTKIESGSQWRDTIVSAKGLTT